MAKKTSKHLTDLPIVGERFTIQQADPVDCIGISLYRSDSAMSSEMKGRLTYVHDIRDWAKEQQTSNNIDLYGVLDDEDYWFTIKNGNILLGDIEITVLPFYVEIEVVIASYHQGKGIAEEAVRMMMEWLSQFMPDHFFAMAADPNNPSHMNLVDRLGLYVWPAVAMMHKAMYRTAGVENKIKGIENEQAKVK